MSWLDRAILIIDFPELFGIKFEDYPDWEYGTEPLPVAAQDQVLDKAAQIAAILAAREMLHPTPTGVLG